MKAKTSWLVLLLSLATARAEEVTMKLTSPSFEHQHAIPAKHTGEGADASPALKWEGAPSGTKSFALICDDPDAPVGTWVHWVIYNIPPGTTEMPEGVAKSDTVAGARQGVNDFGKVGYNGPMPPRGHGKHRYFFKLYALKSELDLRPRATKKQLEDAMQGQILAQTELVGTYERK
jgi:Raf kinase inhibitor-like YbhB/YbcL family protein